MCISLLGGKKGIQLREINHSASNGIDHVRRKSISMAPREGEEKKKKKVQCQLGASSLRNTLHKSCTLVTIKKFKNTKKGKMDPII